MNNLFATKNSGQVLILAVMLFTATAVTMILGIISPLVGSLQITKDYEFSKKSYFTAEAASEDVYYRMKNALPTTSESTISLDGVSALVTVTTTGPNEREIRSVGDAEGHIRTVLKGITVTNGFSFAFAVQVGLGGVLMKNGSSIRGNVHANGPIISTNVNPNSYNLIRGGMVSTGEGGLIRYVHATGSAYAHNIENATINKDAHFVNISGTTVLGTEYPNSPDQPPSEMPIPDSLLEEWKVQAADGGILNDPCPYTISSSVTIGPKKIDCDVVISGNNTVVTLTGPVWVNGNLNIKNSVKVVVDSSIGDKSIPVIAHDPLNPASKGFILLENNTSFFGATGYDTSYVMLVSLNSSAENGGSNLAMQIINGAVGNLLVYAPHGEILLENNVSLREVTSYKLTLINNAEVVYSIGLAQPLFSTGPGGTWKIKHWKEAE